MSKFETAVLIIQVICLIGVVFFIWMDYRKRHPPICDNCKWLICKGGGGSVFRYSCQFDSFDHAPKICNRYKPKEGADHA